LKKRDDNRKETPVETKQVTPSTRRVKRVTVRNQKLILDGFLKTFPEIELDEVWLIVFEDGAFIGARGDRYKVYSNYREYVFVPLPPDAPILTPNS
jgi:hypothetical protein